MFDVVIMKNPLGEWNIKNGDRQTDLFIDWKEFEAIQNFINVKLPPFEKLEGESWLEHNDKLKKRFINAASEKGYEMLGRFWYEYDDAFYLSSELGKLREECLKIINVSQNSDLISAANKILEACDDAAKTDSGLLFGCD
jgi:hypothetical protein